MVGVTGVGGATVGVTVAWNSVMVSAGAVNGW
jgi:hypothetical protein